jgi:8-amino-3,8-dideoxy-alpha-D-manno-octulosonate transaminase
MRAVSTLQGHGKPKIGVEEFMSIAERFGFSKKSLVKIRQIVTKEEWGQGPFLANYYSGLKESKVQTFERRSREIFGVKHAIAVSSGTASLHCAFVAAGVGPGTEVICPAIGFMATSCAVVLAGGVPIFCDVDDSLTLNPKKIEAHITPRTVAIAPTCTLGNVYDMDPILKVARKHNLKVVEDCAQSCGATYKGRPVGTLGDLGCFSIAAYKIVGGGEGGLILTQNDLLADRVQQVSEAGGLWRPDRFAPPRYPGELFAGTNYRMSELEGAVDVPQINKMKSTVKRFNTVKRRIIGQLKTYTEIVPQRLIDVEGEVGYSLRFYPANADLGGRITAALQAEGIPCGIRGNNTPPDWHLYSDMYPVILKMSATKNGCSYHCPRYLEAGGHVEYRKGDCPVAEDLYNRVITIQLNQWLTAGDCRIYAKTINQVLSAFCKEDPAARPWVSR